jgi:hypothetical protein
MGGPLRARSAVLTTFGPSGSMHSAASQDAEIFMLSEPSCCKKRRLTPTENKVSEGWRCQTYEFARHVMHSAASQDAEIFMLREPSCHMTQRIYATP